MLAFPSTQNSQDANRDKETVFLWVRGAEGGALRHLNLLSNPKSTTNPMFG